MSKPQLLKLATRRVKMWKAAWRHPKAQSLPYGHLTAGYSLEYYGLEIYTGG